MPAEAKKPSPYTQIIDMPVIGAVLPICRGACRHEPQKKTAQQMTTRTSEMVIETLRPKVPNRATRVSTPRCAFSRATTTAPTKVSQTKRMRESSSEMLMPPPNRTTP
jgi:hypothetical protein